mmetsp:Transcript_10587/g.39906  ORF Transcript_10587/g.39906 Transcript_10587/m.39906 type:complete len:80 (-) Transcript_10587:4-243(-)
MGPIGHVVLKLLQSVVGRFVDLSRADLDVSILTGDVTLKNLALRSDLLRRLGLRVAVRKAIVDRLRIVVPWTDLRNKPL